MDKEKQIQVRIIESAHKAAKVEAAKNNVPIWRYVSWLILKETAMANPPAPEGKKYTGDE